MNRLTMNNQFAAHRFQSTTVLLFISLALFPTFCTSSSSSSLSSTSSISSIQLLPPNARSSGRFGQAVGYDAVSGLLAISQPTDAVTVDQCSARGFIELFSLAADSNDSTLSPPLYVGRVSLDLAAPSSSCHLGQAVGISGRLMLVEDVGPNVFLFTRTSATEVTGWSFFRKLAGARGALGGNGVVITFVDNYLQQHRLVVGTSLTLSTGWFQLRSVSSRSFVGADVTTDGDVVSVLQYDTQTNSYIVSWVNGLNGTVLSDTVSIAIDSGATTLKLNSFTACSSTVSVAAVEYSKSSQRLGWLLIASRTTKGDVTGQLLRLPVCSSPHTHCSGSLLAIGCWPLSTVDLALLVPTATNTFDLETVDTMTRPLDELFGYTVKVLEGQRQFVVSGAVQHNASAGMVELSSKNCPTGGCGHGVCSNVSDSTCTCQASYTGKHCDVPRCPTNGYVVTDNVCRCYTDDVHGHWSGSLCNVCLDGYMGDTCTHSCGCSGHGTCKNDGTCLCTSNAEAGFWQGTACNTCHKYYGGASCNVPCPMANGNRCNAHGVCVYAGTSTPYCLCDMNDNDGYWTGVACTSCGRAYTLSDGCKPEAVDEEANNSVLVVFTGGLTLLIIFIILIFIPARLFLHRQQLNAQRQQAATVPRATEPITEGPGGSPTAGDADTNVEMSALEQSEEGQTYESALDILLVPSRRLREAIEARGDAVPKEFVCPVTEELFVDPVITSDGQTYERTAILQWFKRSQTSPVTNLVIESTVLVPNNAVKGQLVDLYEKYGISRE
eukprot:PhM_4_TR5403/c0_g1_i1/m.69563